MATEVIKWKRVGDVLVVLTGTGPILPAKWDEFLRDLQNEPITKYLGVSVGSVAMTSVQRKQGADIVKQRGIMSVVVTDDRLVRGVVTAVGWLGANVKAFSLADIDQAIDYLEVKGSSRGDLNTAITTLRTGMT